MLLTQSDSSRDGILAAHRVPPQLLVMIPMKAGGFGDVEKAKLVFMKNKVVPIHARMSDLNEVFGVDTFPFGYVRFRPMVWTVRQLHLASPMG
jgi:capsid portal protein